MAKNVKWRPKSSYLAKSKEAKKRQSEALQSGLKNRYKIKAEERKNIKKVNIIEFSTRPEYLGLKLFPVEEVILRVLYGLFLTDDQKDIFKILTKSKGKYTPGQVKSEACLALGARAGKSFIASICALYEATRGEYQKYVSKGEFVYICVIATREKQAIAIIQTNCLRMLENSPVLKKWVKKSTELEITLKDHIKIISGPCNSTALRGLPIAVLILDEIAFYRIEGPKADEIIFNSLRPRQSQFINNKLFLISTAGAKQGLFYQYFSEGFRIQDRLTCQASTEFCNPKIPIAFLEKEKKRDIDNYTREFEAIFSEKLESFFTYELISKPFVLAGDQPYKSNNIYYLGFDQSGLSGQDRFSLSIGHAEKETVIIDVCRSWTTKDLEAILKDIELLKKEYHINTCLVDRYARGYIEASFKRINLEIETRPGLAEIYVVMKSLILQDKLQLPDRADLKAGMKNTLAIYNKSNQLSIYHERGPEGHADELDSCCTCTYAITQKLGDSGVKISWLEDRRLDVLDENGFPFEDDEDFGPLKENYNQL